MTAKEIEELKEYLGMIIDMEKSIYTQKETIRDMQDKMNDLRIRLGMNVEFPFPIDKKLDNGAIELIGGSFALIMGILLFVTCITSKNLSSMRILSLNFFGVIFIVLGLVGQLSGFHKNKQYDKNKCEYEKKVKEYKSLVKKENMRVKEELIVRKYIESEMKKLIELNKKSVDVLNRMYDANIIFYKYRNFAMICSIYEYLDSGRCESLEGAHGAYNLLEMEIRLDKIILKLDDIICNLNNIANNQYTLYTAIEESNRQTNILIDSTNHMADALYHINDRMKLQGEAIDKQIKKMQSNSKIEAYYLEQTQKELHYMNRMDYLLGRNDGVLFNAPPN